jgi:hypothetical protein
MSGDDLAFHLQHFTSCLMCRGAVWSWRRLGSREESSQSEVCLWASSSACCCRQMPIMQLTNLLRSCSNADLLCNLTKLTTESCKCIFDSHVAQLECRSRVVLLSLMLCVPPCSRRRGWESCSVARAMGGARRRSSRASTLRYRGRGYASQS